MSRVRRRIPVPRLSALSVPQLTYYVERGQFTWSDVANHLAERARRHPRYVALEERLRDWDGTLPGSTTLSTPKERPDR